MLILLSFPELIILVGEGLSEGAVAAKVAHKEMNIRASVQLTHFGRLLEHIKLNIGQLLIGIFN